MKRSTLIPALGLAMLAPLVTIVLLVGHRGTAQARVTPRPHHARVTIRPHDVAVPARVVRAARPRSRAAARPATSAPTAAEFADILVGVTNQYAADHVDRRRIGHADCVEAAAGQVSDHSEVVARNGLLDRLSCSSL